MRGRERSVVRSIRGPITLITVGALFALNNFTPYRFDQTWPVILIVFGLLSLLGRSMDRTEPMPPTPPPFPPPNYPPATGGYRQTPYSAPPPGANDPSRNPGGGV
jgi:Domain of unknown function (DUF5668)